MSASKIIQYIHRPTLTELGMGNTHDRYLVVDADKDLSNVFPLGVGVNLTDTVSNKVYQVYSKVETGEFRLKRLGDIVDDYHMEPGDEIVITHYELPGNVIDMLTVNECGRVLLNPGKRKDGKIEDFEIVNVERLPGYSEDKEYSYTCEYNGSQNDIQISFVGARYKRSDSPSETKFYSVQFNKEKLDFDSKKYYYLTIRDGVIVLRNLPKSEYRVLLESTDANGIVNKPNKNDLQVIYYGAPGTGKSHEIKRLTEGLSVIRTTFHPDSDYSSFVGCYKPTMAEVNTHVVPVVVKSGISLQPAGTYKEERITYQFVIQAFLKAYLAAWKKYADNNTSSSSSSPLIIKTSGGQYTITGANGQNVSYKRIIHYRLPNGNLATTWNDIWQTGSFNIPIGGPGRSLEQAISKWIYDKICHDFGNCTKNDFEKGLEIFIQNINETGEVEASKKTPNGQIYVFSPSDNDGIFLVKTTSRSSKNTVNKAFDDDAEYDGADEIIKKLVDKLWEFDDDFEKAWDRLAKAVEQNGTVDATKDAVPEPAPQFLIIEEINRGNCAQIFGDLFQLLDRSGNGFSEYPIEADTDLQQEIERAFNEPGEYHLDYDIDVEGVVENYTSNYNASLSEDIQHGRILLLPSNLYIWATMNTSDQSLFPIDSAFKRRWEWKYVPIIQGYDKETGTLLDWDIEVGDKTYNWWKFLQAINKHIGDITKSEDKKLGFFFCKATNGTISAETFVGKVLFYLWNDVYKDYDYSPAFFRDENKRLIEFSEYYEQDSNNNTIPNDKLIQAFIEKVEPAFKTPAADANPD